MMETYLRWNNIAWRWYCHGCSDFEGYTANEAVKHAWYEHGVVERVTFGADSRLRLVVRPERPKVGAR